MNNKMKLFLRVAIATVIAITAMTCAAACSQWDSPYDTLNGDGYTVSVRYDANGGVFAGVEGVEVVDVFNLDEYRTNAAGQKEIMLVEPDNAAVRKSSAYSISKTDHYFAGWYTEDGEKWDFSKPLTVDPSQKYDSNVAYLTLYAKWLPNFEFFFYEVSADGTESTESYATQTGVQITVPAWTETSAELTMGTFPSIEGKTFEGAYIYVDGVKTDITGEFNATEVLESGKPVKVYTTWRDGTWYRVNSAKQLAYTVGKHSAADAMKINVELAADLDFSDIQWPVKWSESTESFAGVIVGNGHKISNVSLKQDDINQEMGGLFASISADAVIRDVAFENVAYTVETGRRNSPASFGLLAGVLEDGATLEDVTVSGTFNVVNGCMLPASYDFGLICGEGNVGDMDLSAVTCRIVTPTGDVLPPEAGGWTIEADGNTVQIIR